MWNQKWLNSVVSDLFIDSKPSLFKIIHYSPLLCHINREPACETLTVFVAAWLDLVCFDVDLTDKKMPLAFTVQHINCHLFSIHYSLSSYAEPWWLLMRLWGKLFIISVWDDSLSPGRITLMQWQETYEAIVRLVYFCRYCSRLFISACAVGWRHSMHCGNFLFLISYLFM